MRPKTRLLLKNKSKEKSIVLFTKEILFFPLHISPFFSVQMLNNKCAEKGLSACGASNRPDTIQVSAWSVETASCALKPLPHIHNERMLLFSCFFLFKVFSLSTSNAAGAVRERAHVIHRSKLFSFHGNVM